MKPFLTIFCLLAFPFTLVAQEVASGTSGSIPIAPTPGPVQAGDWATYNYNAAGWRFNDAEQRLSPGNINGLELKWRFPKRGSDLQLGVIHATPSVVDGYVYFGTATHPAFYCITPRGEVAWMYDVGGEAKRRVRDIGDTDGRLIPQDGVYSSALVTEESVYFGDVTGIIYCLDRVTGEEKWIIDTHATSFPGAHEANVIMASPIVAGDKIVFGGGAFEHPHGAMPGYLCCNGRGFVTAVYPESGEIAWKYDVGPEPETFDPPLEVVDERGTHIYHYGPSTSSVWSTPSYDRETNAVFFGTDVHNSPRKPTTEDPRDYTEHSAAIIAVDASDGSERWVAQLNKGDVWNYSRPVYDTKKKIYKDQSIGDTPKLYTIELDGKQTPVAGAGCKNGGYYVIHRQTGKIIAHTPIYTEPPNSDPKPDPRTLALPSAIGGLQTGCATDGQRVYTNGIDKFPNPSRSPGANAPTGGRVTAISLDTKNEFWRHERPKVPWVGGTRDKPLFTNTGDPIASGITLAGGLAFCTTFSSNKLLCIDASTGELLKEFSIGPVLSSPSVSRGQVYVGTGNTLFSNSPREAFFPKKFTGELLVFGLSDEEK